MFTNEDEQMKMLITSKNLILKEFNFFTKTYLTEAPYFIHNNFLLTMRFLSVLQISKLRTIVWYLIVVKR
jgi:hypothetical protein